MNRIVLGILGALAGAIVGHFVYIWIYGFGFSVLLLPGILVGIGAALPKAKTIAVPVASGVVALLVGVYTEWATQPFIKDESLGYFISHIGQVSPLMLLFIALGAAAATWIPMQERSKTA